MWLGSSIHEISQKFILQVSCQSFYFLESVSHDQSVKMAKFH